jgi:hypothetical protein
VAHEGNVLYGVLVAGNSLGFLVTKEWRGIDEIPSDVESADNQPEVVLHFCG